MPLDVFPNEEAVRFLSAFIEDDSSKSPNAALKLRMVSNWAREALCFPGFVDAKTMPNVI